LLCVFMAHKLSKGAVICPSLFTDVVGEARAVIHRLGLPRASLDATLSVAKVYSCGQVIVYIAGDGSFCYTDNEGIKRAFEVRYRNNMPAYPNYLLDDGDISSFDEFDSGYEVHDVFNDCLIDEGRGMRIHVFSPPAKDITGLFLSTDGVSSFTDPDGASVSTASIWSNICNVKSHKGLFLTRRMKRFLSKTCLRKGWLNRDDLAVAGILMADTE